MTQIVAVVGAAGGVGTTRLTVECGATLARAGRDVAIVDTAFATQGLRSYIDRQITEDVTALLAGEVSLGDVLYDISTDLPGQLSLAPVRAPFERLARAQTAGAAQRLERQLAASSLSHDFVLVDTPPLGGNHAVASANAAEQIVLVTTETPRGRDALALMQARLEDIGETADAVWRNRTTESVTDGIAIPESESRTVGDVPVCASPEETFAPAVADAVEETFDISLDLEFPPSGRFGSLRS